MQEADFDNAEQTYYNKSVTRVLKQSGKRVSIVRDKGRLALLSGKRISRTGKVYWETRKNRSDALGKRI